MTNPLASPFYLYTLTNIDINSNVLCVIKSIRNILVFFKVSENH